jgi:serine/threonine protein kinase
MVTSELGACEWFVLDLQRSGLIDRGQLDQVVGEYLRRNPRAEPPALAEHLVAQNILTPFQAERILQGKTQGLVLGPYVLTESLGSGSMGQVYKAQSKTDSLWYAIKVLPRRSMWNVRLARRQVRAFTQFAHPAVIPFVDVGTAGGFHYLAWPLAEGEPLEARVQREGKLSPAQSAQVAFEVAQGLAAAHQHGVFHGLIKPSNILIGPDGQAHILDFGIGSLLVENDSQESLVDTMSTSNTLMSGLDCASPESIMEPTNRTPAGDQYSLGCMLYYCLTGRYPFPDGTAVEKMTAHQLKEPEPVRKIVHAVPEGLAAIVEKLMQKSPDNRYASAEEVADTLFPYSSGSVPRNMIPHLAPPPPSRAQAAPVHAPAASRFGGPTPMQPATRPAAPPSPPPRPAAPAMEAPPPPPRPAPAMPTRGTIQAAVPPPAPPPAAKAPPPAPPQAPARPPSAPKARAVTARARSGQSAPVSSSDLKTPGWVPEQKESNLPVVLIVCVFLAVVALTFFLGKSFFNAGG